MQSIEASDSSTIFRTRARGFWTEQVVPCGVKQAPGFVAGLTGRDRATRTMACRWSCSSRRTPPGSVAEDTGYSIGLVPLVAPWNRKSTATRERLGHRCGAVSAGRRSRSTCECGEKRELQYGEDWTCESCRAALNG